MNDAETLLKQACEIIEKVPALRTRLDKLQSFKSYTVADDLYIGVLGVTSCGKTAFVNALQGEALFPEEASATTNLLVMCRWGKKREACLFYRDRRKPVILSGKELNKKAMAQFCSEKFNPGNSEGLDRVEWTTPSSIIPPGLVLVDTPGLDAFGYQEHQDITLRQFLPLADIVVYMTSIRNSFKGADIQAVVSAVENDQRVLFVCSQIDLEVDSNQGGKIWKSRDEKLKRQRQKLEDDIHRVIGVHSYGIELVSSHSARDSVDDRQSEKWMCSGFDRILSRFSEFREQLKTLVSETRLARIRVQLDRTVKELQEVEKQTTSNAPLVAPGKEKRIEALETTVHHAKERKSRTLQRWLGKLDVDKAVESIEERVGVNGSIEAFDTRFREESEAMEKLRSDLLGDTDRVRDELREMLKDIGLEPARFEAAQKRLNSQTTVSVDDFVSNETREVRVRGWFKDLAFWPKYEKRIYRNLNKKDAIEALKNFVKSCCNSGLDYLNWWKDYIGLVFLQPIEGELSSEQGAAQDIERLARSASENASAIRSARKELEVLLAKNVPVRATESKSAFVPTVYPERPQTSPHEGASAALRPLLACFRELEFQTTFDNTVSPIRRTDAPVLLIGADRTPHLRLLSLLAHDLNLLQVLEEVPADTWIVTGNNSVNLPGKVHRFKVESTVLARLPIVVAPADKDLPKIPWPEILSHFSAFGIEIDGPRISTGLSDLHASPYREVIYNTRNREHSFFLCGNGAFFHGHRLLSLMGEVVPCVRDDWGECPWFIYEDYDARYTRLVELHQESARGGNPRYLIRRWRDEALSFDPPFTQSSLNETAIQIKP